MKTTRRSFIGEVLAGIVASTFLGLIFEPVTALGAPKKKAAEIPLPAGQKEVAADDAVASAIGYVRDTSAVDRKRYPQFKPGQQCKKCSLFTAQGEGWGKCQMIAEGLVRANGWCGSFNPKT